MNRVLIVHLDGRKHTPTQVLPLLPGKEGNAQTARIIREIVRHDARQADLKIFARRVLFKDVDLTDTRTAVSACFDFCQEKIEFVRDPEGIERIADLWSCLFALHPQKAIGDCVIKTTALCTLLGMFAPETKPKLAMIRQSPDLINFNHIYAEILLDGRPFALDPTPAEFRPGDEQQKLEKAVLPIF